MKRIIPIALLISLLTSLPAHAATWFTDGEQLHRDPFCEASNFGFDSFYTMSMEFATADEAQAAGTPLCEVCSTLGADTEIAPVIWYYNPDGGEYYHRDANCSSVNAKFKPLSGTITAERPDWLPENACKTCGHADLVLRSPSDTRGWNASVEDKAAILPGVWTLPSENAIRAEKVLEITDMHLKSILPEKQYVCTVAHYTQDELAEPQETYKVIVTTVLRHPVCVIYIDALTGEVYKTQMAAEFASQ